MTRTELAHQRRVMRRRIRAAVFARRIAVAQAAAEAGVPAEPEQAAA